MRVIFLLHLLPLTLAFQFPFTVPGIFKVYPSVPEPVTSPATPRIAIIGAGAGGASAAFWLSKAKERFGLDIGVDIYEQSSYVGGRSTVVYPYENESLIPVELGASIFVKANKNLWRATEEFNLTRRDFKELNYEIGIWDGEAIVVSFGNSWFDTLKLLWRYGFSPKRMQQLVDDLIKTIITLYDHDSPKWDSIESLADHLRWGPLVQNTTAGYIAPIGVSESFAQEIIEGSTRVNYAQNIDNIHALGGTVSMATAGATSVEGGNYKIFENFVNKSGAKLFLNTSVTSIKSKSSHSWTVHSSRGSTEYQAVVLAAPFHSSRITLPPSLSSQIPQQPYIHLHVTLLTTTSPTPNPAYFSLSSTSDAPRVILTTYEGVRKGGKEPEFNSMSYHGLLREGEWIVKIFSQQRISDEWLQNVFNGQVGWVHRKEWDSYPILTPTSTFPPIRLDRGLFYVNAFEPFISTMETETVASRNVIDLLLNEEFQTSLCGARISGSEENATVQVPLQDEQDFIYGWDC
ncbi:Prenylcysteine lyase-domain-containing protein [Amanita rubescens]|nr:Prenylcysteine lyase-domain-containing protein [Amanita rubescens]